MEKQAYQKIELLLISEAPLLLKSKTTRTG